MTARQETFFSQNSAMSFRTLSETSSLTSDSNQSVGMELEMLNNASVHQSSGENEVTSPGVSYIAAFILKTFQDWIVDVVLAGNKGKVCIYYFD